MSANDQSAMHLNKNSTVRCELFPGGYYRQRAAKQTRFQSFNECNVSLCITLGCQMICRHVHGLADQWKSAVVLAQLFKDVEQMEKIKW